MKLHGIKVPHKKNTADCEPVRIPIPKTVTIPMSMHIGKPAKPIVKKGDTVKVGQLIGEPDGFVSSTIHSSVSGKVTKVDDMISSMGMKIQCITIESDGQRRSVEPGFFIQLADDGTNLVLAPGLRDSRHRHDSFQYFSDS